MKTLSLVCAALLVLLVLFVLSDLGASWTADPGLRPVFWFVLFLAAGVLLVNARRIADWLRAATPPVVEDARLGRLTHDHGIWRAAEGGKPVFWLEGRRTGPDPELVRAGSEAMSRIDELEAQARALVSADTGPVTAAPGRLGPLTAVSAYRAVFRGEPVFEIRLSFEVLRDGSVLDVYLVGNTKSRMNRT